MNVDVQNMSEVDLQNMFNQLRGLELENNRLRSEMMRPNTPVAAGNSSDRVRTDYKVIPRPEKFSGERVGNKVREFSRKIKRYLRCLTNIDQTLYMDIVAGFLVDSADTWFNRWERSHPNCSVDQMLEDLVDHFSPSNLAQDARRKLSTLRQLSSVRKYSERFRELLEDVDDIEEIEAKTYFVNGLKDQVKMQVRLRDLEDVFTLDQVEHTALQVDSIMFYSKDFGRSDSGSRPFPSSGVSPMQGVKFGRLSAEEVTRYMKENRCFTCGQQGSHTQSCGSKFRFRNREQKMSALTVDENKDSEEYSAQLSSMSKTGQIPCSDLMEPVLVHEALMNYSKVNVLFDTGASSNFIKRSLVLKHKLKEYDFGRELKLALGDDSKSDFTLNKFVKFMLEDENGKQLEIKAFIIPSMSPEYDLILGIPAMKQLGLKLDKSLSLVSEEGWKLNLSQKYHRPSDTAEVFAICVQFANLEPQNISDETKAIISEYNDVFTFKGKSSGLASKLGKNGIHKIVLNDPNQSPIKQHPYRMSPYELDELKRQIDDMMSKGWICPSDSPWSSPVLFTKKKNGKLRLCVDYRQLNTVTKSDHYPIPRIDDNLDRLANCSYFSILDLASGFHQMPLDVDSEELTSFNTRYGQFKYRVMPFGLKNAPSSFQRMMNIVLHDLVDRICVVYIDDILIYSKSKEEHIKHIKLILDRLREYNLVACLDKCRFCVDKVEYLGFTVSKDKVEPQVEKVKCIVEWPVPQTQSEIRSFLGLCNYYRRFVKNYTEVADPLICLMNSKLFEWQDIHQKSFNDLKQNLSTQPVLTMPDFSKDFHVWPDASKIAVGGILTQMKNGQHKPIYFISKKLSKTEQNYPTIEREMMAIIHCLRKFRCYIEGKSTIIHSDHKPLVWARSIKQPKARLWGWIYEMEHFNGEIVYQKGENQPADPLSRIEVDDKGGDISAQDPFKIYCCMASVQRNEAPSVEGGDSSHPASPTESSFGHAEDAGECVDNCKIYIKTDETIYLNNFVIDGMSYPGSDWPILCGRMIKDLPVPLDVDTGIDSEFLSAECKKFQFKGNVLCRKVKNEDGRESLLPFIVSEHRDFIIGQNHEVLGHMASKSVYDIVKRKYWWPSMMNSIRMFIAGCRKCQLHKSTSLIPAPLHPIDPTPLPFERWGIDFIQDLTPSSRNGSNNIITAIDYATRWVVARPTSGRSGEVALKFFFEEIISRFGVPQSVITDRALCFTQGVLNRFFKDLDIKHLPTSSYHPRTNGMVERMHRNLKGNLTKLCDGQPELWEDYLQQANNSLNFRIHEVTKETPFYLLYGVQARMPGDIEHPTMFNFDEFDDKMRYTARELSELGQKRAAAYFNSKAQMDKMKKNQGEDVIDELFRPGMFVKRVNHDKKALRYKFTGPYIIDEVLDNSVYRLMLPNGQMIESPVHQDDLRHYDSKDTSQFYYGNRVRNTNDEDGEPEVESVADGESEIELVAANSEDIQDFSEGGVVTVLDA